MRYNILIIFLSFWIAGTGCNVINPVEKTPTYLHVDSFDFATTDYVKEGTGAQKINSAWVYCNNHAVGVFNIPFTIPIIMDGRSEIQVIPGVAISGLNFETQYPFFSSSSFTTDAQPGGIVNYSPKSSYYPSAVFQWKEDFELGNSFIETNTGDPADTSIIRVTTTDKVLEGAAAGYIYLDATHPSSENITNASFPIKSGQAYMEIHYKASTSFQIGLQTAVSGTIVYEYIAGVKAKETWNKLYIDLSVFTANYHGKDYRLMIKTTLDDGLSTGYVLMDNIKIISF